MAYLGDTGTVTDAVQLNVAHHVDQIQGGLSRLSDILDRLDRGTPEIAKNPTASGILGDLDAASRLLNNLCERASGIADLVGKVL